MKYLLSVKEVRNADNFAIENLKIPSAILMENAAKSSADYIINKLNGSNLKNITISVFCGSGNNGGDGFAIARHLYNNLSNTKITVYLNGKIEKMSPETRTNFDILKNMGIDVIQLTESVIEKENFKAGVIIDSLIGVGGSENLRGKILPLLKKINTIDALKFAIDIPTGLNADSGIYHEDSFKADHTITMFSEKKGMYLNNATSITGNIKVADLGAPNSIVKNLSKIRMFENSDIRNVLPHRKPDSIKFDFGRVFIIAGSSDMPGAATLTANSSVRTGAGLTYLITPQAHSLLFPEVIKFETKKDILIESDFEFIQQKIKKASVIAIGPGIGNNKETLKLIRKIILESDKNIPLVIDADALKAINSEDILRKNIILTPHIGEFANLIGRNHDELSDNIIELLEKSAKKMNCTIHLKHNPSVTTDGENSYWLNSNNPGLSCGGSGDVLTGIIAALSAQNVNLLEAGALGAFIHLMSANHMSENISHESLKATDLIEGLKKAI